MEIFQIFGAVLAVSLVSLIGILAFFAGKKGTGKFISFLVSLSAGTMIGGAFLHLIPEAAEKSNTDSLWLSIIAGIVIFFILEKIICWRHCHIPTSSEHPHHLGVMNLVGDALHNFIDGMIIAGAFLADDRIGWVVTIGIILHEIPQEISDFGVLLYAGYSKVRAIGFNFLSAAAAFLGAGAALLVDSASEKTDLFLLPFAAGGFIYIATADLIPELKKETALSKSMKQLAAILLGIILMMLIKD